MKLKLPAFLETWIVKFALSKSGPYLQKAVTLLAAYLVSLLANKIPGIETYVNEATITGIIWIILDSLLHMIPSDIIKKYGKEIQTTLVNAGADVKIDGLVLSKTTAAIDDNTYPTPVTSLKKVVPKVIPASRNSQTNKSASPKKRKINIPAKFSR